MDTHGETSSIEIWILTSLRSIKSLKLIETADINVSHSILA